MVGEANKLFLDGNTIVPIVTPFNSKGYFVDEEAVKKICKSLWDSGVRMIIVGGRTGDLEKIIAPDKNIITGAAKRNFPGKVLVCVGDSHVGGFPNGPFVGKNNVEGNIRRETYAGSDAIVVPTLFYGPETHETAPKKHGVEQYFMDIVELARESRRRVLLYNNPAMTGREIPLELVADLASNDYVFGIEDISGDMDYFAGLLAIASEADDFVVLQGCENLITESMAEGADGIVSRMGNVFPDMAVSSSFDATMQHRIDKAGEIIYGNNGQQRVIDGLKYALQCRGLHARMPSSVLTGGEKEAIEQCVAENSPD